MALKVAARGRIPPFMVMEVMRAANQRQRIGGEVFHLEVGQPSTPAPTKVLEAAKRALTEDRLGYTEALGIPGLRQAIAGHCRDSYGIAVDPGRIVVTTGSSGAFLLSFLSAFEHGDRVALASPSYPAYRNILLALGIEPVALPAGPETRFQPSIELIEEAEGRLGGPFDGLIVASPSNPTGSMLLDEDLERLVGYCQARGIRFVSDEIYHGITYERAARSALAFGDEAIIINSFSKYFSMTGWRLGWMVVPTDLSRAVECLAQNLFISPPTLSQRAALAVFEARDELDANVARYARNREVLIEGLPQAGFEQLAPADGAFYLYVDVAHMTNDSRELCERMLKEVGVAATPGLDFDPERGNRTVRFSFAGSTEEMAEAVRRLKGWGR